MTLKMLPFALTEAAPINSLDVGTVNCAVVLIAEEGDNIVAECELILVVFALVLLLPSEAVVGVSFETLLKLALDFPVSWLEAAFWALLDVIVDVGTGPVVTGKLDLIHLVSVHVTVCKLVVKTVAVTTDPKEFVDFLVVVAGTFVV